MANYKAPRRITWVEALPRKRLRQGAEIPASGPPPSDAGRILSNAAAPRTKPDAYPRTGSASLRTQRTPLRSISATQRLQIVQPDSVFDPSGSG